LANHERRVVFFDLDGTLHQQDMFGTFMRYLLRRQPLNALLVLPLLPVVGLALLIKGRAARWPMSLLLWGCTFGHSEARLKQLEVDFAHWFRGHVTHFRLCRKADTIPR
jgi:phosphatidylglycerophosphatase C